MNCSHQHLNCTVLPEYPITFHFALWPAVFEPILKRTPHDPGQPYFELYKVKHTSCQCIVLPLCAPACQFSVHLAVVKCRRANFKTSAPVVVVVVYLNDPKIVLNTTTWGQISPIYGVSKPRVACSPFPFMVQPS